MSARRHVSLGVQRSEQSQLSVSLTVSASSTRRGHAVSQPHIKVEIPTMDVFESFPGVFTVHPQRLRDVGM